MIDYLLRNNIENKLYALGFMFAVIGYSFWQPIEKFLKFGEENSGAMFFLCIALSFSCYTSAYLFTKWNKWRIFPMFVALICVSRVLKEIYYIYEPSANPTEYSLLDYVDFLLTIWLMFNYYVKYRYKQHNERDSKHHEQK